MRHMAALLVLLLACGAPLAAGRLLLAEPPAPGVLRVGFGSESRAPMSSLEDGQPRGLEALLIQALASKANLSLQIVPLSTFEERLPVLMNGTVDAVINSLTVTAERSKLVQFVSPGYYSAGATLFAPGGRIEGVSSWDDLKGKTLAVMEGNYVIDAAQSTPALQNVTLIKAPTAQEAAKYVLNGTAVAYIDDSTNLYPAPNLTVVWGLDPILRGPLSIAVQKGNDALAATLSDALLALAEGGPVAPLLQMEGETFGAAGAAPNPDLAALVGNPAPGASLLYPAEGDMGECGPVPSDSIWLPDNTYQPVLVWNVTGVQNWTCDPATGNWTYQGWLVNASDFKTGKHAGYALTVPGPNGTHVPSFVATDEQNSTVMGMVVNVWEAGSVDAPSPHDPANTFWYRRPAFNQTGTFASPKVLYLTKTDTQGGALPPGTRRCQEGETDRVVASPVTAVITFYACRESP